MKDEFTGTIIREFIGLMSKKYSLAVVVKKIKKKGVHKSVVGGIRHKKFVDVLFGRKLRRHRMNRIQNKLHRIVTYDICKISLSCFDDKRYILDDGINSLAYFHKDVRSQWEI